MESKHPVTTMTLTIQSGGMIAFEKTGSYPQYLVFNAPKLRRTWRLKLKEDAQNGVLKVNGQVAFNYFFDEKGCKMQSVNDGVVGEEWEIDEIMIQMRD
jgi:hypothetical protein